MFAPASWSPRAPLTARPSSARTRRDDDGPAHHLHLRFAVRGLSAPAVTSPRRPCTAAKPVSLYADVMRSSRDRRHSMGDPMSNGVGGQPTPRGGPQLPTQPQRPASARVRLSEAVAGERKLHAAHPPEPTTTVPPFTTLGLTRWVPTSAPTTARQQDTGVKDTTPETADGHVNALDQARKCFFGVRHAPPLRQCKALYARALEDSSRGSTSVFKESRAAEAAEEFRVTSSLLVAALVGDENHDDDKDDVSSLVRRLGILSSTVQACFHDSAALLSNDKTVASWSALALAFRARALACAREPPVANACVELCAAAIARHPRDVALGYAASCTALTSSLELLSDRAAADAVLFRLLPKCLQAARSCSTTTEHNARGDDRVVAFLEQTLTVRAEISHSSQRRDVDGVLAAVASLRVLLATTRSSRHLPVMINIADDPIHATVATGSIIAHLLLTAAEEVLQLQGTKNDKVIRDLIADAVKHLELIHCNIDDPFAVRSTNAKRSPRVLRILAHLEPDLASAQAAYRAAVECASALATFQAPLIVIERAVGDPSVIREVGAHWLKTLGITCRQVRAPIAAPSHLEHVVTYSTADSAGPTTGSGGTDAVAPWRFAGDIVADASANMTATYRYAVNAALEAKYHGASATVVLDVTTAPLRALLDVVGCSSLTPTMADVARSYRREAARWHPDSLTGLREPRDADERDYAKGRFHLLQAAYDEIRTRRRL